MNHPKELLERNFPTADQDARQVPKTSRYAGPDSSYALAFTDTEFLLNSELRPVRMQLELLKPEMVQREENIESTIVIFGSARILPPDLAAQRLAEAQALPEGPARDQAVLRAQRLAGMSRYYEEARRFASMVTVNSTKLQTPIYVVTGGGPGIMEAGNRGAPEAGAVSVALNIDLPHEQQPNPYVTDHLCFQFHYFALRKLHFVMRARALVAFPGGFGTLDEVFEILTLIQTHKTQKVPVLLYGSAYWKRLIDFDWMLQEGTISQEDVQCFQYVDSVSQAWSVIEQAFDH